MSGGLWLVTVAIAAQGSATDSLRLLATRLPESALVLEVRARPLVARDALTQALARAAAGNEDHLTTARRLAAAYAVAWSDSFLVRDVERFAGWPLARRASRVWVDSVRHAGIAAYGRDGPAAAIRIWKRALTRATANRDSVGIGALLGNLGAGLWREGRLDSATIYLDRARATAAATGDIRAEANAIAALANVAADRGDLAGARAHHVRALALRERIGDTRGVAMDQNNLGLLAQEVGDLDEAGRRFEAALLLNRRDGRDEIAATNLLNLATLSSVRGDFARAERLSRDALAVWREREMWAETTDALRVLGQLEVRRGDYPSARSAFQEAITILDRTGPVVDAIAVRSDLAATLGATGAVQAGLDVLRGAQHRADSVRAPPAVRAGIALARADLAVQLNAFAQADESYVRAERLYRLAGDANGEAEAQQGRGTLFLERDDHARAQSLLEGALRTQLAAGNRRSAALTRLSLADVAHRRGEIAQARQQLSTAVAELERLGDPVAAAAALGERARLEASLGLPVIAESLYRAALRGVDGRVAPEIAWRLHSGLALTRRTQGFVDDATRGFRAALLEIERPSRAFTLPERRSGFLADKWDVYAQLALTERARGRAGTAFESSERMRAREMLELLARGRIHAPRDTAEELIVREQDLRRRIAELTRGLETSGRNAERRGPALATLDGATREALLDAQTSYMDLRTELADRAPRHAALVMPRDVTWRDVAARLSPRQALIEYLVSDSGIVAFVIRQDTVVAIPLGTSRRQLVRLVEFARGTLERGGAPRADSLWQGPLRRLHHDLIAPIEDVGLLERATQLVIVPHGELHYLPFAGLLDDEGRSLIERHDIVITPSAAVWLALGSRPRTPATAGILALAPRPDALPGSRREVTAITRTSAPGSRALVGSMATEDAFRREAPAYRVLHLATYGILNKHNPLFSFVELAPGGGHDGRLEVHEVFGLRLSAELVVLSACQTGLGSGMLTDVPPGDDWVGLTRAFLHAGARSVVATLWPVDDWATAALMERVHAEMAAGAGASQALARAQRALRAERATANPFYWAGFIIVGGADAAS